MKNDLNYFNLWFTGLSGSGKTTTSLKVSDYLNSISKDNEVMDGDVYRAILSPNANYSSKEREAFRKKVIYIAKILNKHGISCIIALLSSSQSIRDLARQELQNFVEVYVKCPIEVCIQRDPKGLYDRRKNGLENSVVGIDIPYEEPVSPEIVIETNSQSLDDTVKIIIDKLNRLNYLDKVFVDQ